MNTLQRLLSFLVALMMMASLSACGTQPGDRAISGALLGAAAGGAVFALFPGTPITLGLATGGALGGIAGGLTLPEYLYLGEPVWYQEFDAETMTFRPRQPIPQNPGMQPQYHQPSDPQQTQQQMQQLPSAQPQSQQQMQQYQQPAR